MSVSAIARRPGVSGRAGWVTAAVGVLAAFAVVGLISDAIAPTPQGPASSSYATTPAGVAAWAELLARAGLHVIGVEPAEYLRARFAERLD